MPANCAALTSGKAPATRPVLVYEAEAGNQDLALGTGRPRIQFEQTIPSMEGGRYNHVIGWMVQFVARVDTTDTMTAAMTGELLLALMGNIQQQSGGRQFFQGGFDARRVFNDTRAQYGGAPIPLPETVPDATAANVDREVNVLFMFGPARKNRARRDNYDGAVPMSMLDSRKRSKDVLEWQWASALPTAPTGVVLDSIQSCRVWAFVVASKEPRMGALPFLDEVSEGSQQVTIERMYQDTDGCVQYAQLAYVEEDADGLALDTLGTFTIRTADTVLAAGQSVDELQTGWQAMGAGHGESFDIPDNTTAAATAGFLESDMPDMVPLVASPPGAQRKAMSDGPIIVNVTTLGDQELLRVLVRSYSEPPDAWKRDALKGFGLNPDDPELVAVLQRSSPGAGGSPALVDVAIERKG